MKHFKALFSFSPLYIISVLFLSSLLLSFSLVPTLADPSVGLGKESPTDYAARSLPVRTKAKPMSEDLNDHGDDGYNAKSESTHELLERHGLGFITDSLSDFITLFDKSTHFFSRLNNAETFVVLNRFIAAFIQTFSTTFGSAATSKDAPSGPLTFNQVKDLLDKQESILKATLIKDDNILNSEWSSFISKIHLVFDSLKDLYKLALDNSLSLNWWMVSILAVALKNVPEDLFSHATFEEFLGLPGTFQTTLHDALNSLMESQSAPMIRLALSAFTNYQRQKRQEQRDSEL